MPVIALMDVPGATTADYDRVSELLGVSGDDTLPDGLISHVAADAGDGIHIVDVWDAPESLQRFFAERGAEQAMAEIGATPSEPRFVPVHNLVLRGAGTQPRVIMEFESDDFSRAQYDQMTQTMPAHEGDQSSHPAVSHVAGVPDDGGLLVVDVWDSPESWGRFAEEQIAPAAQKVGLGAVEPRFTPVHRYLRRPDS